VFVSWEIAGADHGPVTFMQTNNLSDGTAILGVATGKRLTDHGGVGIWGRATGGSGRGVVGIATDTQSATIGVLGEVSSTQGFGVLGLSKVGTGMVAGVRGESSSQAGAGVWGISHATKEGGQFEKEPAGVRGMGQVRGVVGIATSPFGFGGGTQTWGVDGLAVAQSGVGVRGRATAGTGFAIGVKGESSSPGGWAMFGEGHGNSRGVLGRGRVGMRAEGSEHGIEVLGSKRGVDSLATGSDGIAVRGAASSTTGATVGVLGQAYSPSGIAVRAVGTNGARAGQFEGDVYVLGGGHLFVHGNHVADLAEDFPLAGTAAAGDVVILVPGRSYGVARATTPYDRMVVGIVSAQPRMRFAVSQGRPTVPIALVGVVRANATARGGAIRYGDLLTTSSTAGHLMRCASPTRCLGTIVGKALQPLHTGAGQILVLIWRQ